MKLKATYPVKSVLRLNESWTVRREGFEIKFDLKERTVSGISAEFEISKDETPKVFEQLPHSKIAADITIPEIQNLKQARSYIRRIQTFLDTMAPTIVDFESEELEWIPENKEERKELKLYKFSISSRGARYDSSLELTFDFIAALSYHAYAAESQEIALTFVQKGNVDFDEGRYISAFYNYFLSLETQFFAGFSDPKKVKLKLKKCGDVHNSLKEVREALQYRNHSSKRLFKRFSEKSDDELLDYIVDVRGRLHHHAPKGPASWHPGEEDVYKEEAYVLKVLAGSIANAFVLQSVYATESGGDFFRECEAAGAVVIVDAKGVEITPRGLAQEFEVRMRIPSLTPHAALIESLNNRLREKLSENGCIPKNYELLTANGDILASYSMTI